MEQRVARRRAQTAVLVTVGVYVGYGLLGLAGVSPTVRALALVAAFYFVPGFVLRKDRGLQARYGIGPGGPIPPWSWRSAKVALVACVLLFPPFVVLFMWFYARGCAGNFDVLAPVLWCEGLTPWAGGLERFLGRLCASHGGGFWPESLRVPTEWLAYGGLGAVLAVAVELFATAMPEEVFHRGYLMNALEDHYKPKRKLLGVPLGLAAVLASLLFALGHLVGMAEVARLVTFFPALLFAWLFRKSGSLWAPALVHSAANLLMSVLIASTFPR